MVNINGHDGISRYYNIVNKYPLLTVDQERELALRIRDGDKEAKEKLIVSNLRLVASIAKEYAIKRSYNLYLDQEDFLDLAQEGTIGLMKAVDRFDPSFDCKFSTYAGYWIRQRMIRAIKNDLTLKGAYRTPVGVHYEIKKLEREILKYEMEKGQRATEEELAEEMEKSIQEIRTLFAERRNLSKISLNDFFGEDENELIDSVEDKDETERILRHHRKLDLDEVIENACSVLSSREKELFVGRFLKEETLEELGKKLKLTRARVEQLEKPILRAVGQYTILFYPEIAEEFIAGAN